MTRIAQTLTFLSLLALAGCAHGSAGAERACTAYQATHAAVCAACRTMPDSCPFGQRGPAR